jgi:hypothetical protein
MLKNKTKISKLQADLQKMEPVTEAETSGAGQVRSGSENRILAEIFFK